MCIMYMDTEQESINGIISHLSFTALRIYHQS